MKSQNYLGAALVILGRADQPMSIREITVEAIRQGLIRPAGKTPEASMSSSLYTEINSNPNTSLARLAEAGPTRARRGSVRWALRDNRADLDQ